MPARASRLRSERGQTAAEYLGLLLVVAVIVGLLTQAGVGTTLRDQIVEAIGGTAKSGAPDGKGPGGERADGNGGADGKGRDGSTPGSDRNRDGKDDDTNLPCVGSAQGASQCLIAAEAPNQVREKIIEQSRERYRQSMRDLRNSSARPGSPEYRRLVDAREAAKRDLVNSRTITNNRVLKALANVRKVVDPRAKDILAARDAIARKGGGTSNPRPSRAPAPNRSAGGPVRPTAASRVLKGLAKTGKGLGVVGTALGAVDNVKKDGVAKGLTKTGGSILGGIGGGAAVAAGCAAVGVATAGVGAVACAGGAFVVGAIGAKFGGDWAGKGFDKAKKVGSALNPFD